MQRSFRWRYYSKRQRDIAIGLLLGSTTSVGLGIWHLQKPQLAESGSSAKNSRSWSAKATDIAKNATLSERSESESAEKKFPRNVENTQSPPPQTKGHGPLEGKRDDSSEPVTPWESLIERASAISDSLTGWDFKGARSKVTEAVVPSWVRILPGYVDKLRDELSGAPWSLSWECWEDAHDPEINPEILWDAHVRISQDLCSKERSFLERRREHTRRALAKYLDVPDSEVHADDVPVIGLCGSGGGLRALVSGAASALCAQRVGLLDCVTYTAGVSGSCWLQTLFNNSIGKHNLERIIAHLKQRINVHIAYPPAALSLLSQAPTNKFLLSGFVEKMRGVPDAEFGLVDIYGLLLASRLLVPKGELRVTDADLKLSNQAHHIKDGKAPLPIYTAVRHEVPEHMKGHINPSQSAWHNTKHYDWFQWFEWTPFEFFSEELGCGIPTWAVGRKWNAGGTVWRENGFALPEMRIPLIMGIWGSAFCATLSHYYREVRPILKAAGLGTLDSILSGNDDELVKVHPVDPAVIPNYCLGLREKLPDTLPESIHSESHLQLMDAGMSNNLPIYPLLRPGRNVDIIIAFDASADVKNDNWIKVVDGYVRQRGIKGWPMGAGWPQQSDDERQTAEQIDQAQAAEASKIDDAAQDFGYLKQTVEDLGYCTVWVGTTQERNEYMDEPAGLRVKTAEDEWHLQSADAGVSLIYLPFLPNPKVEGVDPMKSDFMSTWNFIYTPEEVDKVVELAEANFVEGKDQVKRTIKAVWERKRDVRLRREKEGREAWMRVRLRRNAAQFEGAA